MPSTYGRFGDCHLFGHAWDYTNSTWASSLGGVPVTLLCQRCTTERRETWSQVSGEMMNRRYLYPKGYSLAQSVTGVERPTRDELRAWALEDTTVAARRTALRSVETKPDRRKRRAG